MKCVKISFHGLSPQRFSSKEQQPSAPALSVASGSPGTSAEESFSKTLDGELTLREQVYKELSVASKQSPLATVQSCIKCQNFGAARVKTMLPCCAPHGQGDCSFKARLEPLHREFQLKPSPANHREELFKDPLHSL